MTYRANHATDADRRSAAALGVFGHGTTSDAAEAFVGSPHTPLGRRVGDIALPRDAVDVRRLWQAASQGQQDTWTDIAAVAQDGSGFVLSPKPHGSAGTDVVATGLIQANELGDGGTITIEALGTYSCGSILPRILARLKIGGFYVTPNYEAMLNAGGTTAAPANIAGVRPAAFEWSSQTCGLNALSGYEALWVDGARLTQGEFQWRLTMRVSALGRYAKWSDGCDVIAAWSAASVAYKTGMAVTNGGSVWECVADHTSAAGTEPGVGATYLTVWRLGSVRKCWVEATLEWGAMQYNGGCRVGEPYGYYNASMARNLQYHAATNSLIRGAVYSFGGTQYLCHAGSATTAWLTAATVTDWADATDYVFDDIIEHTGPVFYRCIAGHTSNLGAGLNEPGAGTDTELYWQVVAYNERTWTQMLAEEAPGIGMHWKDFFVPLVSKATISGFAYVDTTIPNEIQLELGGPQQVDLGTAFAAYGATTAYLPEAVGITPAAPDGTVWAAKIFMYTALSPHLVANTLSNTFTEAPDAATVLKHRCWRQLPTTLRDTMRVQTTQAYLFGRRNGTSQRRLR